MTQQFRIESESLRDQINKLLPSQARGSIDVDLTGSTTIIPIVDLTETAEGSSLRQDLQTSFSHTTATSFNVSNATSTLVNTTGYYRVFGNIQLLNGAATQYNAEFLINDGTTTKSIFKVISVTSSGLNNTSTPFDFLVKLQAGDSLQAVSSGTFANLTGCTRQIADLSGNLTNP